MKKRLAAGTAIVFAVGGLIAVAVVLLGSDGSSDDHSGLESLEIETASGDEVRIDIEIAAEQEERSRGLSNRTELADDTGMLFIIPTRGPGFWMKDTFIPLSVAFIGRCGEIVDIQDMEPQTQDIHQADAEYAFGLEVNQGWFAENDVAVGDVVSIPSEYRYEEC